jgi:hypothetical protein
MDTLCRRIVGPGLALAAVLIALSWGPTPARGQMFGYGMPGYGGYGMGGYGGYGYPGFGYGGYAMGGYGYPGFGYGYPGVGYGGFGYGYGYPAVGYGFGGGLGYPVGLPSPAYGYYGGPYGYGISGPGAFNPLFGMGLTPLGVQSAQAERYLLGRGLTGSSRGYSAPATNTTYGTARP